MAPSSDRRSRESAPRRGAFNRKAPWKSHCPTSLFAGIWKGTATSKQMELASWSRWADYDTHDVNFHSWRSRLSSLREVLVERGGFNRSVATRALVDPNPKSKEKVALWLRDKIQALRKAERRVGEAPVLTGASLSRLTIADIAMTMLQFLDAPPRENLICLLQELLGVDRHRQSLSERRGDAFLQTMIVDALKTLQGVEFGVRDLASFVGVEPSTVTRWRRRPEYKSGVEELKQYYRKGLPHWIRDGRNRGLSESESFERAFTMLYLSDDAQLKFSRINFMRGHQR
jgi:hypothetical protein